MGHVEEHGAFEDSSFSSNPKKKMNRKPSFVNGNHHEDDDDDDAPQQTSLDSLASSEISAAASLQQQDEDTLLASVQLATEAVMGMVPKSEWAERLGPPPAAAAQSAGAVATRKKKGRLGKQHAKKYNDDDEEEEQQQHANGNAKDDDAAVDLVQKPPAADRFRVNQTGRVYESHKYPIYSIAWSNPMTAAHGSPDEPSKASPAAEATPPEAYYLASCANRYLTVYLVRPKAANEKISSAFELVQSYMDPDPKEDFYACVFAGSTTTHHSNHHSSGGAQEASQPNTRPRKKPKPMPRLPHPGQYLCVAGAGKAIKVLHTLLDGTSTRLVARLQGHGHEILDLKVSPIDPALVLSASKDESVRLWNVQTRHCLAVFGGYAGHRDCVISVGWHALGQRIVSAGMDSTIKLWDLGPNTGPGRALACDAARPHKQASEPWVPYREHFSTFSTTQFHGQVVDCVQFVGDCILSKSTENCIILWAPDLGDALTNATRTNGTLDASTLNANATTASALTKSNTSNDNSSNHNVVQVPSGVIHLKTFQYDDVGLWFVKFATDPTLKYLAVCDDLANLKVWDMDARSSEPLFSYPTQSRSTTRAIAFSPCGSLLSMTTESGAVLKFDCTTFAGSSHNTRRRRPGNYKNLVKSL